MESKIDLGNPNAKKCSFCSSEDRVKKHYLEPKSKDNYIELCKKCDEELIGREGKK